MKKEIHISWTIKKLIVVTQCHWEDGKKMDRTKEKNGGIIEKQNMAEKKATRCSLLTIV